jgi:hypothetical protein
VLAAGPTTTLYEMGDDLEEDELATFARFRALPLAALPGGGLKDGDLLHVHDDSAGKFEVEIKLVQTDAAEGAPPHAFVLQGDVPAAVQPVEEAAPAAPEPPAAAAPAADGDECVVIDDDEPAAAPAGAAKRKRDDDGEVDSGAAKKGKQPAAEEDDEIVIL